MKKLLLSFIIMNIFLAMSASWVDDYHRIMSQFDNLQEQQIVTFDGHDYYVIEKDAISGPKGTDYKRILTLRSVNAIIPGLLYKSIKLFSSPFEMPENRVAECEITKEFSLLAKLLGLCIVTGGLYGLKTCIAAGVRVTG